MAGRPLQEDYNRQTLQNFHNKLLSETGKQHTFGIFMIVNTALIWGLGLPLV